MDEFKNDQSTQPNSASLATLMTIERITVPCGHQFHKNCLMQWLAHGPISHCPICRAPVARLAQLVVAIF